jgi:hypothetical protein
MEGALPTNSVYEPGESALFGSLTNTVDPPLVADPRGLRLSSRHTSAI